MAYTTIDDPTQNFNTVLYTGDGTAIGSGGQAITGVGFAPSWTWIKERSSTSPHKLLDTVRGATKELESSGTDAEATTAESLATFGSDGFTVGNNGAVNQSSQTYVSWNWKAGSSASSNSDGTITSSVSVDTTHGFSIVSYTGNATSGATVGHGLGAVPGMILIKNRDDGSTNWNLLHKSLTGTTSLFLDLQNQADSDAKYFNNTNPTSSVFTLGNYNDANGNSEAHIAYCFAEKQGYSKFGSFTGNGNDNGSFVNTGFRPAWVMIKLKSGTDHWPIDDNKRAPHNIMQTTLRANLDNADYTGSAYGIDFLSNGFKLRNDDGQYNLSDGIFVYMAFAEQPFVNSSGVPCNAR